MHAINQPSHGKRPAVARSMAIFWQRSAMFPMLFGECLENPFSFERNELESSR